MRKTRSPKRPRFTVRLEPHPPLSAPGCEPVAVLAEIDEYIRDLDIIGLNRLREVASDVLDGWANKEELRPFFRQKLMTMVRHDDYEDQRAAGITPEFEDICGHRWTVMFTERAVRIFWPHRA